MTPREIVAAFEAQETCLTREANGRIVAAYYTAALVRWNVKKRPYPTLQSLIQDVGPRREPTVEDQWRRMKSIAATRRMMN